MTERKLEIGAGARPQEGYEHLDNRPGPHIEIVADARKIPLEDNTFDEVYSHWVLEHFAWREMTDILTEWRRVLKPGGKLKVVTNNQEAHNKCLQEGKITWAEWVRLTYGIRFEKAKYEDSAPTLVDCHKIGFNKETLEIFLRSAGFVYMSIKAYWDCRQQDGSVKCPGLIAEAIK
jgi:predicted SAM-dependent methyltransferase